MNYTVDLDKERDAEGFCVEPVCEHETGIMLFDLWRFSIVRCTWGCNAIQFKWKHRDGITRTFMEM